MVICKRHSPWRFLSDLICLTDLWPGSAYKPLATLPFYHLPSWLTDPLQATSSTHLLLSHPMFLPLLEKTHSLSKSSTVHSSSPLFPAPCPLKSEPMTSLSFLEIFCITLIPVSALLELLDLVSSELSECMEVNPDL